MTALDPPRHSHNCLCTFRRLRSDQAQQGIHHQMPYHPAATKLQDGFRTHVDAFATFTTCGDLDLCPPEPNQVIRRG